jgi:aspartate dehydrogenase
MLAFATAGLDATQVELVADPTDDSVRIAVDFSSDGGNISYEMQGKPSSSNPRTGMDVPFAVIKAIKNLCSPVFIGA